MAIDKRSNFTPTMVAFLEWFLRTLDPKFTEPLLAGRSLEDAAAEVLDDIVAKVRGNRPATGKMTASDYGAIMDRISALHLRTRHGEQSVSEDAVS